MISLFLKKTFFDGWDNLFSLALLNILFTALLVGECLLGWAFLSARGSMSLGLWEVLALLIGYLIICLYAGGSASFVNLLADYQKASLRDFFAGIKRNALKTLLFGLLSALIVFTAVFSFRFYASQGGLVGTLASAMVFWVLVVCALSLQFFFPVLSRLKGSFPILIKKCFLIALDNPGFALFMGFWTLSLSLMSVFVAGLLPGPAGIQLALCDALRLRMRKYDYLEENPTAPRRKIPWKELLVEEEELIGKRDLRGMLFPWKEGRK